MISIVYMILATAMFALQYNYFSFGGMELSLKNPCAVAILFLAFLTFIVKGRLDRLIILTRHMLIHILPYIISLFFSAIIWVGTGASRIEIVNGIGMIIPPLLSIMVAVATLYIFGSKGVWYCLGAMCIAYFIKMFAVIRAGGIVAFITEFYILLATFSVEAGSLIRQMELHDLVLAFGPFLIYLLLYRKEISYSFLWLLFTLIPFLVGLKRIAVLAVILSFFITVFVRCLPEKSARQVALGISFGMMIISFLYIVGIRNGLFQYLEAKLGFDTKGRVTMFANMEPYYDISFTYIGKGMGFERFVDWASGKEYQIPRRVNMQIHNDFLRMYMNIGFIGYWIWCFFYLFVRLCYWFRQGGKDSGCLFLSISIYCFALYATDNTIYYPYVTIACSLISMSYHLDILTDHVFDKYDNGQHGTDYEYSADSFKTKG